MSHQGVDLTAEAGQTSEPISWHQPHTYFAILLVGEEELPFGIQKDLLAAQSPYFREKFRREDEANGNPIETIIKLPRYDVETFGCFQNFIYTGQVYDKAGGMVVPEYVQLLNIWKLATHLKMAALRVAVLDAMVERRHLTSCIPGVPFLIQAWKETEEGSGLRIMLTRWTAEHMRASAEGRNEFARSLPKEILSELVIVMSELPHVGGAPQHIQQAPQAPLQRLAAPQPIHDLEVPRPASGVKRPRKSEAAVLPGPDDAFDAKPPRKQVRRSEPARRTTQNSKSSQEAVVLTPEKDLQYCRGLITRMVSGPGFWTRLVANFKHPVDPVASNMPNYFAVVKRPMDLKTIKAKMDRNEYATAGEFEADVRLIFQNCYEYWTNEDPVFKDCEKLEKYFNEQWAERHKYVEKRIKNEITD